MSQFEATAIAKQELVLIVPNDHPLAQNYVVDLRDTLDYPYVFFDKTSGLRPIVAHMFAEINETPKIAYEVSEDQSLPDLSRKISASPSSLHGYALTARRQDPAHFPSFIRTKILYDFQ